MTQIHVNGRDVELVTVDELTLDEAIVLYEWSKLTLDQIPDLEGFHPGLIAALIHISVARAHPNERQADIRRIVGAIPVAELEQVFAGISEEVDDTSLPPPVPLDVARSSSGPSDGSGAASSPTGTSPPDGNEATGTGSPGSDTGATFDRATSAR